MPGQNEQYSELATKALQEQRQNRQERAEAESRSLEQQDAMQRIRESMAAARAALSSQMQPQRPQRLYLVNKTHGGTSTVMAQDMTTGSAGELVFLDEKGEVTFTIAPHMWEEAARAQVQEKEEGES